MQLLQGQAKLKLYEDRLCTKEAEQDVSGKYLIKAYCITGEPTHYFDKKLYVKNFGTHPAYNIKITTDKGTTVSPWKVNGGQTSVITIRVNMEQHQEDPIISIGKFEYSNLQ